MEESTTPEMLSEAQPERTALSRGIRLCCPILLLLTSVPALCWAQMGHGKSRLGSEPTPRPAIPALLAAFDKYEVVALPEAHGMKDLDDFILSLIRYPAFLDRVNDIEVECGNSLYQPILDRYIDGENVPFTEVQKVWRNTTQPMCGNSAFFETFFPLVRAINQKLPPEKRLRVLAGDPPIDWDKVRSFQDYQKFYPRDVTITSVMEKEVLSKHRKALMLFGILHLVHGGPVQGADASAVSIYEKKYPNVTFVVSDLGAFDSGLLTLSSSPFTTWPVPSLALAKRTWLGALDASHFFPVPAVRIDKDCNIQARSPKELQKPMAELVDAFLYLGPQSLRLRDKMPADITLDVDYRKELLRRYSLPGFLGAAMRTVEEEDRDILKGAADPLLTVPQALDVKALRESCLESKSPGSKSP